MQLLDTRDVGHHVKLTQCTKEELRADMQRAGLEVSFECSRKVALGKRKSVGHVRRTRNRASLKAIAESMEDMDNKYNHWKKDIANLKDIDAYDFDEAGVISILLDFFPYEDHSETCQDRVQDHHVEASDD